MYIDVVACAGPEVHVLHTNRFELHTCTYTSGFGQYQASSAALATQRERGGREGEETESIICIHSSVGPRPPLTISVIEPLHIYSFEACYCLLSV